MDKCSLATTVVDFLTTARRLETELTRNRRSVEVAASVGKRATRTEPR